MKRTNRIWIIVLFAGIVLGGCKKEQKTEEKKEQPVAEASKARDIWTKEQATEWYKQWGWLRGSDFIPSTAINQLEMWQAESFDTATINRELGWAENIGMSSMRVYLHHLAWEVDPEGFKQRVGRYLAVRQEGPSAALVREHET